MNYKKVNYELGKILLIEAALMALPSIVALIYKEKAFISFAVTIALLTAAGLLFSRKQPEKNKFYAKEGYLLVALAWVFMSAFGALPFVFSKSIPNFVDAFFETVSGFTTTGSTILTDVECLPRSIQFWRSFTHFIGGMGILVFVIAILPKTEGSAMHVMRAEVPGPTVGKLVSKLRASARILYAIYCGMTLLMAILLIAGGMPIFDSILNSFATAGTGGFGILNDGIAGYNSPYCEVVIAVFMMLFGVNFNLYYLALLRQGKAAIKNEELRWYLCIVAAATAIITFELTIKSHPVLESLRLAFFQVTSIISTTGFSTADFNLWPVLPKAILLLLMFIGGCVGSTGGGLKVSRIIVLCKNTIRSVKKAINPRSIETVKLEGQSLDESLVSGITGYFSAYMLMIAISIFIVAINGHDLLSTITGVITCFTNVGPGFGEVGPVGNFSAFSWLSKLVFSFDMLAGRLELIPVFILFSRYAYSSKNN